MNPALIAGIVAGAVMSGTSLLYATLGEIVGERAGIVNLGLEGIMLIGAASGFAVAALTGSPYLGIAAAAIAGAAANLVFAYVVVSRRANQLAAGLSLMFFGIGLSALIGRPFVGALIGGLPRLAVPGLAPGGIGARLLSYDSLVYLALPTTLLIDRQGKIASVHVGVAMGKEDFKNAVVQLLNAPHVSASLASRSSLALLTSPSAR